MTAVRPQDRELDLTSQGHPHALFRRAIERGNLVIAETTARELGRVSLADALELVALIAQKDPRRHSRAAARWLELYLQHAPRATLEDAALAVGCWLLWAGRATETRSRRFGAWPKERLVICAGCDVA